MNIAFLTLCFNKENTEAMNITTKLLAKEFSILGHKVFIITHRNKGEKKNELMNSVRIFRPFKRRSLNLPFYLDPSTLLNHFITQAIGVFLIRQKIDIIINVSSSPTIIFRGLLAKLFKPKAKLVSLIKAKSSYKNFNFFKLLNFTDLIITSSKNIKKELKESGVKKRIEIINSPINTEKFISKNKNKLRKKYGFTTEKLILYYGHFNRFKGVEYLISSLKYLRNVKLLLIPSKNSNIQKYNKHIRKEKVNVKILSSESNIVNYINLVDAVVLPYPNLISTEANPSCVFETLACGTPLITSNLIELTEVLIHKETCLLANKKDPEDLAKNINLILKNKNLRKKLIKNGVMLSKNFDSKFIASKFLRALKNILII